MHSSRHSCLVALYITLLALTAESFEHVAEECPGKDVTLIRQEMQNYDIALLYYYTSWSIDSQAAKQVYDELAAFYSEHIYFAAADCWHLSCNCNLTASMSAIELEPEKWPRLFVSFAGRRQIQYHGDWRFEALVAFIENVLKPVERVHKTQQLAALKQRCDAVVFGLFENSSGSDYRSFAVSAIKWLEYDPEHSICFALAFGRISSQVLKKHAITTPMLVLMHDDDIKSSPFNASTNSWNSTNILLWLRREHKRLRTASSETQSLLTVYVHDQRKFYAAFDTHGYRLTQHSTRHCFFDFVHQQIEQLLMSLQMQHQRSVQLQHSSSRQYCEQPVYLTVQRLRYYYFVNDFINHLLQHYKPSFVREQHDQFASSQLLSIVQHNKCLLQLHVNSRASKIQVTKYIKAMATQLSYEADSKANGTMSVLLLDADKHQNYLPRLGIRTPPNATAATIFIADALQESTYLMQQQFSLVAIVRFLSSYHHNPYALIYRATAAATQSTAAISAENAIFMAEYNQKMFLDLLQQQNVTIVALFYSNECGFSSMLSHALLQTMALLNTHSIRFVRVNIQWNELPWHFIMPDVPTLVVFPRNRSAESRIFPKWLQANVRNIFGFILAQLEPIEQLTAVVSSCRSSVNRRLHRCLQFAKSLIANHIEHHLKLWQGHKANRSLLLQRLKHFKDISLDIQKSFSL